MAACALNAEEGSNQPARQGVAGGGTAGQAFATALAEPFASWLACIMPHAASGLEPHGMLDRLTRAKVHHCVQLIPFNGAPGGYAGRVWRGERMGRAGHKPTMAGHAMHRSMRVHGDVSSCSLACTRSHPLACARGALPRPDSSAAPWHARYSPVEKSRTSLDRWVRVMLIRRRRYSLSSPQKPEGGGVWHGMAWNGMTGRGNGWTGGAWLGHGMEAAWVGHVMGMP